MPNVKTNIIYSTLLTSANYIFALITFPYVSRVLGVENIGICNFVNGIVNYYFLFSTLGIVDVAIREVAIHKGDNIELSRTFSSVLTFNLITAIVMMVALVASVFIVPKFYEHRVLMLVGAMRIFFSTMLIEWLYKGLEDFRYITIRSLFIHVSYAILIFIFIKKADDYPLYFTLTVFVVGVNALINCLYSRKKVRFSFKNINFKPIVKPSLILGVYLLLTSMYTSFNVGFLGFAGGEIEVGYYTTATKLHSVILAVFTAFTSVMLPRMSSLVAIGNEQGFNAYLNKSISFLFAFSVPLVCLCTVYADSIVSILSGPGYEKAVPCMMIVMPLIFIIGYEQVLIVQTLMPLKKDNAILINSICGAVLGIALNFLIVPSLKSIGAAIVWSSCELLIMFLAQYKVKRYIGIGFPMKLLIRYIVISVPILAVLLGLHKWSPFGSWTIILAGIITAAYFGTVEVFVTKNELVISTLKAITKKQ